jgi:hypothetical protein
VNVNCTSVDQKNIPQISLCITVGPTCDVQVTLDFVGRVVTRYPRGEVLKDQQERINSIQAEVLKTSINELIPCLMGKKPSGDVDSVGSFDEGDEICYHLVATPLEQMIKETFSSLLNEKGQEVLLIKVLSPKIKDFAKRVSQISPYFIGEALAAAKKAQNVLIDTSDFALELATFTKEELERLAKCLSQATRELFSNLVSLDHYPIAKKIFEKIEQKFKENSPKGKALLESILFAIENQIKILSKKA